MQLFVVGFVIEALIVVVIIAVVAIILWRIFGSAKSSATTTQRVTYTSGWVNPPPTIPAAPATGTFTYQVTQQKGTALPEAAPDRNVRFVMTPSAAGAGHLTSVTQAGAPLPLSGANPPALMFVGSTDTYGIIQVVVTLELQHSATLVASDPGTGAADPAIIFTAV